METDPTRIVEILVGLGADVRIVGVDDVGGEPLRVHVRVIDDPPGCEGCGATVELKDIDPVELVDLAAFGGALAALRISTGCDGCE